MNEILLALALSVCAKDSDKCTWTEITGGSVVTVCGLAPEERGRPVSFNARLPDGKYLFVLEPKCVKA